MDATHPHAHGRLSAFAQNVLKWNRWWHDQVVGTVDQSAVIDQRREECALSARYLFMTSMAAGIAILGLLQSSPAVVIGAMLLSPLMGPIIGLGFALAIGDYRWLRQAAISLTWGTFLAIFGCALIVFLSPLQDITPEIAARTRPNLFDLLIALFSALAGAYALIRGREGTIVGVAIATALMPPLAVVGFGLATFNWTVFSGALLLYVTNLVTIALTAWGLARLYGFSTSLTERQTQLQNIAITLVFIALAVPLGISLWRISWETNATRQIRIELASEFDKSARLSQPEINFDSHPINVSAFAWTTKLEPDAQVRAKKALEQTLGTPIDVQLQQYLVRDEKSAEQAQLAASKEQEEEAAKQRVSDLAARLSLAAGVSQSAVLIDRQQRRALVRANALPGASLRSYAALESRIRKTEPDWTVELIPPPAPLPPVEVDVARLKDGKLDQDQTGALALAAWASARSGNALRVIGSADNVALVVTTLAQNGATDILREDGQGPARIEWSLPPGD